LVEFAILLQNGISGILGASETDYQFISCKILAKVNTLHNTKKSAIKN